MNTTQSHVPARQSVDSLLEEVSRARESLVAYLPSGIAPDRFEALARRAVQEQPALADCSSTSVLRALREAAISGLELDGRQSTLIIRKSKQGRPVAVWDATYKGMTSLALASGFVRAISAQVVRAADTFRVRLGSDQELVHEPVLTGARGEVVAVYAIAELTTGARMFEVMTHEDLARIRAMSPAADKGPWGNWDDEMARKSVTRRLLKKLPCKIPSRPSLRSSPAMPSAASPRSASQPQSLLPEDEHALECAALERLSAASTIPELDAAWAQAQIEYQQRGAALPLRVEARYHDLREHLAAQEDAPA